VSVRRLLSSLLPILSLIAGCATALPPPREAPREDAQRAVSLLAARWQEFSDLRTLADVRVTRGSARQQFTGALLLKAPASLRFEALSPFGQPLLLATMHAGEIVTYNVAAHAAVVGPATATTAARLFSLPVEPDELVGVLAGRAVPPKDLRVAAILPPDAQGPSLEMIGALHRQRVWMDFGTGIVRQIQITGGRVEALVTYQRAADGALTGFDLTAAQDNVTGTVRYRDLVVGAGVDPERFRLTIPAGASIERLR
jgi:outer membrane lipoprotein-sorting protein